MSLSPSPAAGQNAGRTGPALVGEVGKWPKVSYEGDGYLIEAPHESPRREDWPGRLSVPTAIAAMLALTLFIPPVSYLELAKSVAGGIFIGWLTYKFFWPRATYVRLKIHVTQGGATWKGPHAFCRIEPFEKYESKLHAPHRLAAEQQRVNAEKQRRGHTGKMPVKFIAASELVVHTGGGGQFISVVADIAYDSMGESNRLLQAAFVFAIEENRKEVLLAKQQAEATKTKTNPRPGRDDD